MWDTKISVPHTEHAIFFYDFTKIYWSRDQEIAKEKEMTTNLLKNLKKMYCFTHCPNQTFVRGRSSITNTRFYMRRRNHGGNFFYFLCPKVSSYNLQIKKMHMLTRSYLTKSEESFYVCKSPTVFF